MPDPIKPHQPVPGKPIPSLPTPVVSDKIYTEVIDAWQGKYEVLPYGTAFNSVEHGTFPKDLPDHILVFDGLQDASGQYRKRVWASNRIDQDEYNYEITYNGGDPNYPDYVRSYVYRRDEYSPVAELTADPDYANAFLVKEVTLNSTEPPELSSQYIKVVRIYRTLPGPVTHQVSYPYGGLTNFPRVTMSFDDKATSYSALTPGTACTITGFTSAVLISEIGEISKEENGVINVKRVYDTIPASTDQQGFGYSLSYLDGDKDYPIIEWAFQISLSSYAAASDLSACPISGFTALLLVNQKTKGASDQNQIIEVSRRYETLPGPLTYDIEYDNNDVSYPVVKTNQRTALNAYTPGTQGTSLCPVSGYTTLILYEQNFRPTEFANVRIDERMYEILPGSISTTRMYDPVTKGTIITARQKVVAGGSISPGSLTLDLIEQPIDRFRSYRITSAFSSLPATKVEYKTQSYKFPALLFEITINSAQIRSVYLDEGAGIVSRSRFETYNDIDFSRRAPVPAIFRVTTSFHDVGSLPSETLDIFETKDIIYAGIAFNIDIRDVLCDAMGPNISFSGVNDGKYNNLVETVNFTATTVSATDYTNNWIGNYAKISVDQERYKGDVWTSVLTEVLMI